MTYEMGNTDKLAEFRAEAERLAIRREPPSINRSGVVFEVDGARIHYALAALKGVGNQAVEAIVAVRGGQAVRDLADFAGRVGARAITKRVVQSLAPAGAFDAIEPNRARVHAGADLILAECHRRHEAAVMGQSELFGGPGNAEALLLPAVEPWLPTERLQEEYEAIG